MDRTVTRSILPTLRAFCKPHLATGMFCLAGAAPRPRQDLPEARPLVLELPRRPARRRRRSRRAAPPRTHSLPRPARLTGCQTRGFAPVTFLGLREAKFPSVKSLDSFDFLALPFAEQDVGAGTGPLGICAAAGERDRGRQQRHRQAMWRSAWAWRPARRGCRSASPRRRPWCMS
jgi:hypothetical protein